METRISGHRVEEVSSSLGFDNMCHFDAFSFRGGIWILWNEDNIMLNILSVIEQSINVFIQVCPANPLSSWIFSAIYASPELDKRLILWNELSSICRGSLLVISMRFLLNMKASAAPFPIADDYPFLMILSILVSSSISDTTVLALLGLTKEVPAWSWNALTVCYPISNGNFSTLKPPSSIFHLHRTSFDHHLILIDTHPTAFNFGPRLFCLETIWFNDLSFPNLVRESWNAHPNDIALALLDFTLRAKSWNWNTLGNIFHRKKRLLAQLSGIQKALCFNHSDSLLHLERKLSSDY